MVKLMPTGGRNPPFAGKLYPNGEITIGYCKPKSARDGTVRLDDRHYEQQLIEQERVVINRMAVSLQERWEKGYQPCDRVKKARARRGSNGISAMARRKVKSACYLLEKKYGRRRLGFLTLTIPNGDWMTESWIENWPDILRKTLQEIRRELKRQKLPTQIVGVVEIQMGRFRKTGMAVPHLHLVYVCKHKAKGAFRISASKFRAIWKRVLINESKRHLEEDCLDCLESIEWNASVDCQVVKKSAEGYLGKYLTKGKKDIESLKENDDKAIIPTAWYTIDTILGRQVAKLTFPVDDFLLSLVVFEEYDCINDWFDYLKMIEIPISQDVSLRAWVGRIKDNLRPQLQVELIEAFVNDKVA